jgi:isocitrate dehydrogenase kinase/phosphatase
MALQPLIHNSTARRMAKTILNGFRSYFADYLNSTLTAKARFEKADWHGVREANVERLELYKISLFGERLKRPIHSWYSIFLILKSQKRFLILCSVIFMIMTRSVTILSM